MEKGKRLYSLDVFRGFVIAAMILVNNPGSWDYVYRPLDHAPWNGMTPTDYIFPFFIVIMGISAAFSLKKYGYRWSSSAAGKIIKRTLILMLVGYGTGWLGRALHRAYEGKGAAYALWNFDTARIMGVMVRLALVYLFLSILALSFSDRTVAGICACLLVVYSVVLLVGHGFEQTPQNIVGIVDRALLPENHRLEELYDPEGVLSTIPAIAQGCLGYLCGKMILKTPDNHYRMRHLFLSGFPMAVAGWLLSFGIPLNKRMWSPTFVLVTTGVAFLNLAFFLWAIDLRNTRKYFTFFEAFGRNALLVFIYSTVFTILLCDIQVPAGGELQSLWNCAYEFVFVPVFRNPYFSSLMQAVVYVVLMWLPSLILYRKNIYVKI